MADPSDMALKFNPGRNIAIKAPAHEYEQMVGFYRDILGFAVVECSDEGEDYPTTAFEFGDKKLWVDCCSGLSQSEIWLEINCQDIEAAKAYFNELGVTRCDDIENLPNDFNGFWISSPGNLIHLVTGEANN